MNYDCYNMLRTVYYNYNAYSVSTYYVYYANCIDPRSNPLPPAAAGSTTTARVANKASP